MLHRFRHQIVGILVVMWMLLTVTGIVVRIVVWNRLTHSIDASGEATKVGGGLDELFGALQDAESSQRGYVLTGNELYLEPFKKEEASLSADFNRLSAALGSDSIANPNLFQLNNLIGAKKKEMDEAIRLRKEKSMSAALSFIKEGKGRETMDTIRKLMFNMREQRQNVFSTEWANTRRDLEQAQTTGMALSFLGIGAGFFALYFVRVALAQEQSQRRLLEEKLSAEKTAIEKSAFLANMSHEIRTPMNAIMGFSELLDGEALNAKQARYVRSIRDSGALLLQLINDVLDLSKMEAGKIELHLEPTDMRELCSFLQTMFSQQAAMKGIRLQFDADGPPHALLLDRLRMRQILVNLLGNAIKFTPRGHVRLDIRWISEKSDRSHGTLFIDVEDTGVGISAETQGEIFKPFVQSQPQRNLEAQGTGLGLSIVQRLTQMMNGSITLKSAPGAGSLFQLQFPNVSVSARLPSSAMQEREDKVDFNDFKAANILVVDDNKNNRELFMGTFEGTHHKLQLAGDGQEALESIERSRPDIVLLDLRMPIMDGRMALDEIRKRVGYELMPVVAVTASNLAEEEATIRQRFSGFVRKPFSRRELYDELAQFLRRDPNKTTVAPQNGVQTIPIRFGTTITDNGQREALLDELRALHRTQWPLLRDTLAINDTLAFAGKLRQFAANTQWQPLAAYAEQLTERAEAYSVGEVEQSLNEFPALITALEQSQPQEAV